MQRDVTPFAGRTPAEELVRVFTDDRERLRRVVMVRLDAGLRGRVDVDDVLQEAFLAASTRLKHFRPERCAVMFVWVRMVVMQTIVDLARRHLGARKRGGGREVALTEVVDDQGSSFRLLQEMCARVTSPTRAAARAEDSTRLIASIAGMSDTDREILLLRHFEELSNGEVAEVLGLQKAAATNRYLRAMTRLHDVLGNPDGPRHG